MHTNNLPLPARRRARNLARNARRCVKPRILVRYIRTRDRITQANRAAGRRMDALMRVAVVVACPEVLGVDDVEAPGPGVRPALAWWGATGAEP